MNKLAKYHVPLTITSFLLGILLSVSFYTKSRVETTMPRATELVEVVENLETGKEQLQKTLESLRKEASDFEHKAAASDGLLSDYMIQEKKYKKLAGLTGVEEQGIRIVLADAASMPPNSDPNDYIVHSSDLQTILNVLWRGEAQAVSINGNRLVGTSAIRCVGNTILINSSLVGSPYEIIAIGDSKSLKNTLLKDEGSKIFFGKTTNELGISIELREEKKITVPPYKGGLGTEFARIHKEEDRQVKK